MNISSCLGCLLPKGEETTCSDFCNRSCFVSGPAGVAGTSLTIYGFAVGNPWIGGVAAGLTVTNGILSAWNSVNAPWVKLGQNVNALGVTTGQLGTIAQNLRNADSELGQQVTGVQAQLEAAKKAQGSAEQALNAGVNRMADVAHAVDGEQAGYNSALRRTEEVVEKQAVVNVELGSFTKEVAQDNKAMAATTGQLQSLANQASSWVSALTQQGKVEKEQADEMDRVFKSMQQYAVQMDAENEQLRRIAAQVETAEGVQRRAEENTRKLEAMAARLQAAAASRASTSSVREPFARSMT